MSTTALLIQSSWTPLLGLLVRSSLAALLIVVFRPLLMGLLRAALLVLRPRLSRDERVARDRMRNWRALEKVIASSSGPSDAAELRAIAARL